MEINEFKNELEIKWMYFSDYKEEIIDLRRNVFVENQGIEVELQTKYDDMALHLGAFRKGKLISSISAYILDKEDINLAKYSLPVPQRMVVQLTRRVELPEYRGTRIAELLATSIWRAVYENINPDYFLIGLLGIHKKLILYYTGFGFEFYNETPTPAGLLASLVHKKEKHAESYVKIRKITDILSAFLEIDIPSFTEHLQITNRQDYINEQIKKENLYLKPLSFKDEIPRLMAQARLVFTTQKSFLENLSLPQEANTLVDLGCGTGILTAQISKLKEYQNFNFIGIDLNQDMITYAKLSYRKMTWRVASIYDTKLADNSADVVLASFVFIHLTVPHLALREIYRILKPGGILYVVDVNDATFKGPAIIRRMIKKHTDIYEGNRLIMNVLEDAAKNEKFATINKFTTIVNNSGYEDEPKMEGNILKLGRVSLWAMFAFIGQREETSEIFTKAEHYYFKNNCEISIEVQTYIGRK